MYRPSKLILAVLAFWLAGSSAAWAHSKSAFQDDMRKLWEAHVAWTRLYIISVAGNLPDAKLTADRLLKNQVDIGNAVADFYGRPAADQLTALLKDHILIAADLVGAAKAGDQAKVADANKRWYANANDIADFLHKANPDHWPQAALRSAMKMHLDQTLDEATHRLQGKFEQDIKDYDAIVDHILKMADILSSGIIAQFPAKFDKA
jgi:hypothetical protein